MDVTLRLFGIIIQYQKGAVDFNRYALIEQNMVQQQDALAQLRPHIDGIVFEYRHYRSTFLPQVWEQLPDPETFMAHLKRKAGLTHDFWAESVRLSRYTVRKWKEPEATREAKQA